MSNLSASLPMQMKGYSLSIHCAALRKTGGCFIVPFWMQSTFTERPLSACPRKRFTLTTLRTISSHRCVSVRLSD